MKSIITAIVCILVSVAFAYMRIDGFKSQFFQAFAHGLVFGLFTSGVKNVCVQGGWLVWYQVGLGIFLSAVEILVATGKI